MILAAKYPSTCSCCRAPISVGARIEWSKGAPARHVDCSARSTGSRSVSRLSDYDLAERGLVRVSGPRGSYVRRADSQELEDALGY